MTDIGGDCDVACLTGNDEETCLDSASPGGLYRVLSDWGGGNSPVHYLT